LKEIRGFQELEFTSVWSRGRVRYAGLWVKRQRRFLCLVL
jgi:hypothetical protein